MAAKDKKDIYQIITDQIIEQMEKGIIPWHKPWNDYGGPKNYVSNKLYRGFNAFLLNLSDFEYPLWLTFNQAEELGGKVIKGSKASQITYWQWLYFDKNGKEVKNPTKEMIKAQKLSEVPFLRYYHVFNIAQVEGVEWKLPVMPKRNIDTLEEAANLIRLMEDRIPPIKHKGNQAYYTPTSDEIVMPKMDVFDSPEHYYSTLYHEITHSTGSEKRLAREGVVEFDKFGSVKYGKEELIAEMGASFLRHFANIHYEPVVTNTIAYLQSWIRAIKQDTKILIQAAGQAQKAVDYLLGDYDLFNPETIQKPVVQVSNNLRLQAMAVRAKLLLLTI